LIARAACVAAAFYVLAAIFVAKPADAHSVSGFYHGRWMSDVTVGYRFASNFPTGYRTAASNAVLTWNAVGEPLQFFRRTGNTPNGTPDSNNFDAVNKKCNEVAPQSNHFLYRPLLAPYDKYPMLTQICPPTSPSGTPKQIRWLAVIVNSAIPTPWSTDNTPAPTQNDFQSFFTHEMGHAAGSTWGPEAAGGDKLGHFSNTDAAVCPSSSARNTMCTSLWTGTTWARTLEAHDIHTFQAAY
jgi:hypothetical protein